MAYKKEKDLFSIKTMKTDGKYFESMRNSESPVKAGNEKIMLISLDKVCERYENLFIRDPLALKGLVESIKSIGLKDPIRVISIEEKLKLLAKEQVNALTQVAKEQASNEYNYLVKQKENGYEYSVISGHRRLDSFKVIALETLVGEVDYNSDINELFKKHQEELFRKKEEFRKNLPLNPTPEQLVKEEKFNLLFVPAVIEKSSMTFEDEDKSYRDTNITTREITQFEIITNLYKELLRKGELEQFKKKNGTYNFVSIANHMNEKYKKNINADTLRRTIQINSELTDDFLDLIYSSKLSLNQAKYLLPKFSRLTQKDLDFIKDKLINDDNFNLQKWLKDKFEPKKTKKKSLTRKVFIDYLNEIKSGKKTVEEVLEIVEKW